MLTELRIFLHAVLKRLFNDSQFASFRHPVSALLGWLVGCVPMLIPTPLCVVATVYRWIGRRCLTTTTSSSTPWICRQCETRCRVGSTLGE